MKIKNFYTKNNIFLAPMAGYTDKSFRKVCSIFGAGLTFTEMVSAKGLVHSSSKTIDLLKTSKIEKPVAVQLFGHEPKIFALAVKNKHLIKFNLIDINMGCPANKIIKNEDGGALLKNTALACEIVKACVQNTNKPISVKMRIGYDTENFDAVNFAKSIEKAGASMITVHGRTVSQGYSGKVNYNIIADIVKAVKIPVIVNGDIKDIESYNNALKITNASGVMIGRSSIGNPQIFDIINGKNNKESKLNIINFHIESLENTNNKSTIIEFRKHLLGYLKGINNSVNLKLKAMKIETIKELKSFVKEDLSQYL